MFRGATPANHCSGAGWRTPSAEPDPPRRRPGRARALPARRPRPRPVRRGRATPRSSASVVSSPPTREARSPETRAVLPRTTSSAPAASGLNTRPWRGRGRPRSGGGWSPWCVRRPDEGQRGHRQPGMNNASSVGRRGFCCRLRHWRARRRPEVPLAVGSATGATLPHGRGGQDESHEDGDGLEDQQRGTPPAVAPVDRVRVERSVDAPRAGGAVLGAGLVEAAVRVEQRGDATVSRRSEDDSSTPLPLSPSAATTSGPGEETSAWTSSVRSDVLVAGRGSRPRPWWCRRRFGAVGDAAPRSSRSSPAHRARDRAASSAPCRSGTAESSWSTGHKGLPAP